MIAKELASSSVSRRSLLKGIGLGAVASAFPNLAPRASAQFTPPPHQPTAFKRFQVGSFEITAILDGVVLFEPPMFAVDRPEGTVEEELERFNLPTDHVNTGTQPLLVDTGDNLVLIDTGAGTAFGASTSGLLDGLATLGVAREAIDAVILSHWHPDHVGANSINGKVTFPNEAYSYAIWVMPSHAPQPQSRYFRKKSNN